MNRVAQYGVSEVLAQGLFHAEVDRTVEEVFEEVADGEEVEESGVFGEFDEEVEVAIFGGFVAGDGAEEAQGFDAELFEVGAVGGETI